MQRSTFTMKYERFAKRLSASDHTAANPALFQYTHCCPSTLLMASK